MLIHVVLYRWKKHVTADQVTKALEGIQQLKTMVDGIVDIYSGENLSKASKGHERGFTHALVVIAENSEALHAYKTHPLHLTIATEVEAMEDDGIGVDFEQLHSGRPI